MRPTKREFGTGRRFPFVEVVSAVGGFDFNVEIDPLIFLEDEKMLNQRKNDNGRLWIFVAAAIFAFGLGTLVDSISVSEQAAIGQDSTPASSQNNPLLGAPTTIAAPTTPNLTTNLPTATLPPSEAAPSLESLQALEKQLINQLQSLNYNDPNSPNVQQELIRRLTSLQSEIQRLESQSFARQRQPQNVFDATANLPGSTAPLLPNAADNPFVAPAVPQATNFPNGLYNPNLDPTALESIKNELTNQLKQLQQTLRALQPQDVQLAETLREQQTSLLRQLQEINNQIESSQGPNAVATGRNAGLEGSTNYQPNGSPVDSDLNPFLQATLASTTDDVASKMKKVNDAARLLREAGLVELANQALNIMPLLANPDFKEPSATNSWSDNPNLIEAATNPFNVNAPQEITEIKNSVAELKNELEQISIELVEMNTQLKLLSRQAVSASPIAEPTTVPDETSSTESAE